MLMDLLVFEKTNCPGMRIDVVIVNARSGSKYDDKILEYDGTKLPYGTLYVRERENAGWSYGAYDYAFKNFDYENWLFTENDLFVGGDRYYKRLLKDFKSRRNCGFLGLINVAKTHWPTHCSGGLGITKKSVLNKVVERFGMLPHHTGTVHPERLYEKNDVVQNGEIAFTNAILEIGYNLETMSVGEWGLTKNFTIPYYNYKNHG